MMRSRLLPLFFLVWLILTATPARADATSPTAPSPILSPDAETPTESLPTGSYGEILFFPRAESRPSDERHRVNSGQQIEVCVRLSPETSSFISRLREQAVGLQLLLEDSSVPPHRLAIVMGNRLFHFKIDEQGCFGGAWNIPLDAAPGVYQVSDLLWATAGQSYYSLRRYLYEFSKVEEIEIQNPKADAEPPKLLSLRTYRKPPFAMAYSGGLLKIKLEQAFELLDEGSGIDRSSLRVTYRLGVGSNRSGVEDARCRPVPQTKRYRCLINLASPDFFWNANQVTLSLESLTVRDKAGNQLWLQGEEAFRAIDPKADLVFEFHRKKKWRARPDRNLKRETPLPIEGLGADSIIPESLPQSG